MPVVRVLLADDHELFRRGLAALFEAEADLSVVGHAADGEAAVRSAAELGPDVVVMDLDMPGLDGVAAAERITAARPGTAVVFLTGHTDEGRVLRMSAVRPPCGLVAKSAGLAELLAAVRAAAEGGPPHVSRVLATAAARATTAAGRLSTGRQLSPREGQVLQLIAAGRSTKEIAAALSISAKTAESHRCNLLRKLDLTGVAELTKFALRQGLTPLEG